MRIDTSAAKQEMKAMILSAGRGERLRPLTDTTPKPLLKIGGETLIGRHIRRLKQAQFNEIVINVSHLRTKIMNDLGDGNRYGVRIRWSDEGDQRLGTGGGIRKALPLLGDSPWLVINSDIYTDWQPKPITLPEQCLAYLILVPNPPHHRQGDFHLKNGTVCMNHPHSDLRLTFSGIGYYRAALFEPQSQRPFQLTEVLKPAIETNRVSGEQYTGIWEDIGIPENFKRLSRFNSKNI